MKKRHLALLLLALPSLAAEITMNCDSRVINEKACVALLQDSLKTVGCSSTKIHCQLHPWGSDFIKSWICSDQATDCTSSLQGACPSKTTRIFNGAIDVCAPTKPASFYGVCKHEHAEHSIAVKNCGDGAENCAKFGGTPSNCTQAEGLSDSWAVSCSFPSLEVAENGSSCAELKSKCELVNTDKGVKGSLLSCLPQNKKGPGKSLSPGPFDSN
jgi:hypothetical protein